jgi:uncharacterized protein (DUF1501 family)
MSISRRNFMKAVGGLGVLGVSAGLFPSWMPRLAFAPKAAQAQNGDRDILVAIFQRGGMDGLNAVVPFGEGANYYDRRPSIAIPEPNGSDFAALDLDGFFGFHPALAPLKEVYDADALTVIHAAGSPDPTRSHFDAMEYMERGTPGDRITGNGWLTRHLTSASWRNDSPFRAVGMGQMLQGSLRGEVPSLSMRSIADFHLQGRTDQLVNIQRTLAGLYTVEAPTDFLTSTAAEVYSTVDLIKQLNVESYQPSNGAQYPDSEYGLGLKQIALLIKANVGLEIACVDIGGWDTHESQGGVDGTFAYLLGEFAQGLNAFYTDMQDYMSNITVVSMSEFGRRTTENASGGTDHGHGNCMFVMGGGARGQVYSDWPTLADERLNDGDLAITTDYRDVLSELLTKRILNTSLEQIFPNYTPTMRDLFNAR